MGAWKFGRVSESSVLHSWDTINRHLYLYFVPFALLQIPGCFVFASAFGKVSLCFMIPGTQDTSCKEGSRGNQHCI